MSPAAVLQPELYRSTRSRIGGVAIRDLIEEYGTPTYVYDGRLICERVEQLRAFDCVRFAAKACSNLAVLALLRRQGCRIDAVSEGELLRAERAGFAPDGDPPGVVYTADIFDRSALERVVARGIRVNCGSIDMIHQYGRRVPGGEITVRVNPGFGHGHSRKTNTGGPASKHGIWWEQLDEAAKAAGRYDLRITGVHAHIGSGTDLEHLSRVCDAVEKAARRMGDSVSMISAGGGLPVPYAPEEGFVDLGVYFELWDEVRGRLSTELGHPVRLEIEPGRFLVAESGNLLCEVRAVKSTDRHVFYLLDAGFNDLPRPILYGARHPLAIVDAPGAAEPRRLQEVVVGGPLCEAGDIFTQDESGVVTTCSLPTAEVGDHLVIGCAGAYGCSMSSHYNSKPLAAEVLILDGEVFEIRRRQALEELVTGEIVPPWLR